MNGFSAASDAVDKLQVENWIRAARSGSHQALGNLMVTCHRYLLSIAKQSLNDSLRAKLGASDLVQETALEAHRDFRQFEGEHLEELLVWLRQILLHNATNANRHFQRTEKRKVSREIAWDVAARTGEDMRDDAPTPRALLASLEEEQLIEQSLARLPDDMRRAIVLRNKQHLTFAEIGVQLQRSDEAARKLWARGIERLQQILSSRDERA